MPFTRPRDLRLTDPDLEFLVETASPGVGDREALRRVLREDRQFRDKYVEDDRVFRRVMDDEEVLVRISPALFFEILLRRAARDLAGFGYTVEKAGAWKIPVFDSGQISEVLSKDQLLLYLADMLASFTKVQSFTVVFRERQGVWRRVRFNDLDIRSLMALCELAEEEFKLGLYKRIADICLFLLGLFPDYPEQDHRYPLSGQIRPRFPGTPRVSPEEYEEEGRKFYKLASEHPVAKELHMTEVFQVLHENFQEVKKPLNFLADYYLSQRRRSLFSQCPKS